MLQTLQNLIQRRTGQLTGFSAKMFLFGVVYTIVFFQIGVGKAPAMVHLYISMLGGAGILVLVMLDASVQIASKLTASRHRT